MILIFFFWIYNAFLWFFVDTLKSILLLTLLFCSKELWPGQTEILFAPNPRNFSRQRRCWLCQPPQGAGGCHVRMTNLWVWVRQLWSTTHLLRRRWTCPECQCQCTSCWPVSRQPMSCSKIYLFLSYSTWFVNMGTFFLLLRYLFIFPLGALALSL